MTRFGILRVVVAALATAAVVAGPSGAATTPPAAGKACTKGGATAKAGAVSLVCTKKGAKLVWVAKAATPAATAFSASYTGKATVKISGSRADIAADATGTGTVVGKSKLSGRGVGNEAEPCPLFGGPGTITVANGAKLNFVITASGGSACTDEEGKLFSLVGRATIKGGTGKYAKAKGTFKFTGSYDRGNGLFRIKLRGTLTA